MNMSIETSGAERRVYTRHETQLVVNIETKTRKNRFGVSRNASAGGLLFNTPSRFERDEEIVLTFLFPTRPALKINARVVRVEPASTSLPFRCTTAVVFETPQPELEQLLAESELH